MEVQAWELAALGVGAVAALWILGLGVAKTLEGYGIVNRPRIVLPYVDASAVTNQAQAEIDRLERELKKAKEDVEKKKDDTESFLDKWWKEVTTPRPLYPF